MNQYLLNLLHFFTTKNLYLCISFDIIEISNTNTHEQIFKENALDISGKLQIIYEFT